MECHSAVAGDFLETVFYFRTPSLRRCAFSLAGKY
jgi:hypothetical protein